MRTIEQPIRHVADRQEAEYQAFLAIPRIAAALEKLSKMPDPRLNKQEVDAILRSVGDDTP